MPSGVDGVFVDAKRNASPLVDFIVAVCVPRALPVVVPQTPCIRRVRLMMDGGAQCSADVWRCGVVERRIVCCPSGDTTLVYTCSEERYEKILEIFLVAQ